MVKDKSLCRIIRSTLYWIIKTFNVKIEEKNNKFKKAITELELGVIVFAIYKVQEETMRKVVFKVINGKSKLRKVSQTNEVKCDEIKSAIRIKNWIKEIKYLSEDWENIK